MAVQKGETSNGVGVHVCAPVLVCVCERESNDEARLVGRFYAGTLAQ